MCIKQESKIYEYFAFSICTKLEAYLSWWKAFYPSSGEQGKAIEGKIIELIKTAEELFCFVLRGEHLYIII